MIIVFIEHSGEVIPKSSLSAIRAALELKTSLGISKVSGLLLGGSGTAAAAEQAKAYGLDQVVSVESDDLEQYLATSYEAAVLQVVEELDATVFVAASSSIGKDLSPRVAEKMDAAQASDVLEILSDGGFKRPMYAGNIIAEVELTTEEKVVTIRAAAFEPADKLDSVSELKTIALSASSDIEQSFVSFDTVASERPDLGEAEIVVSGGRAMKSAENFASYIEPLADSLGAAIGASRAAVDSGYAPNDWQVGQTGKIVAPKLYIAIGISGAIQHLAGMKDSKVIVAINTDPEAPIFEVADYGLVADLYDAVPALVELVKQG